jgi:hypothetical protein
MADTTDAKCTQNGWTCAHLHESRNATTQVLELRSKAAVVTTVAGGATLASGGDCDGDDSGERDTRTHLPAHLCPACVRTSAQWYDERERVNNVAIHLAAMVDAVVNDVHRPLGD